MTNKKITDMGRVGSLFTLSLLLVYVFFLQACTSDPYESGDGDYSYLKAEFATVSTDSNAQLSSFITDEDIEYSFSNPQTIDGAKADTTYRALVYYDATKDGGKCVNLRGLTRINVCKPGQLKIGETMKTDPVELSSTWLSENKSYINLGIKLMVGVDEDNADALQTLGIIKKNTVKNVDGTKHITLQLYHDQNNVPEYYSYPTYISIPTKDAFLSGDTIDIIVNTYEGEKVKRLKIESAAGGL